MSAVVQNNRCTRECAIKPLGMCRAGPHMSSQPGVAALLWKRRSDQSNQEGSVSLEATAEKRMRSDYCQLMDDTFHPPALTLQSARRALLVGDGFLHTAGGKHIGGHSFPQPLNCRFICPYLTIVLYFSLPNLSIRRPRL